MKDALILSGVLLAVVLLAHIGRRKENRVLLIMPFFTSALIGWGALADLRLTGPNVLTGAAGIVVGIVVGLGLVKLTKVEWDARKKAVYTTAGVGYLGLWLAVLVGRLAFLYAVQESQTVRESFGTFLYRTGIDDGGVAAFFVAMALTMVVVRTAGVWVFRSRLLPRESATA
ncbi:hypothetical protein [Amycolatopsis benzoatilytica]|uniref:hypothetical protein n=1 Tax=Amycolatopsis benzoatilytica TaxID=346045 RepID=UPI00036E29D5|nr:hypothetical protein [Amycolatopsis benzoatilytica]